MSFGQEVLNNITIYSYGLACLAYALLALGVTVWWRNRTLSLSVIICIVLTSAWAAVIAFGTLADEPPIKLMESVEAARNAAWMFLLHSICRRTPR